MKTLYGRPQEKEAYIEWLYCGVCNNIPVLETKNTATGEIIEAQITDLLAMSLTKLTLMGKENFAIMVCDGCVGKIKDKMVKQMKKHLQIDIKYPKKDDDLPSPTPGESPKSPPPV